MIMMMISIMISIMFTYMKHPLSMGLTLIIQTLLVSLITGMIMNSFWFSYILTLTMLSGMLVLFIYMSSIASNEKFKTPSTMHMMSFMLAITTLLPIFLVDQMKTSKIYKMSEGLSMYNENIMSLAKFFHTYNMLMTILLVCFLFFTMIVINFNVNIYEGPLRMKN